MSTSPLSTSPPPLRSGLLKKLGSRVLVDQWHYRYFVLTPQHLLYYTNKQAASKEPAQPIASFPLDSAFHLHDDNHTLERANSNSSSSPSNAAQSIVITSHQRTIRLRADSLQDKKDWVAAINEAKAANPSAAVVAAESSTDVSAEVSISLTHNTTASADDPSSPSFPVEVKWLSRSISVDAPDKPSTTHTAHSKSISFDLTPPSPRGLAPSSPRGLAPSSPRGSISQSLRLPSASPTLSRSASRSAKRDLRVQRLFKLEQALRVLGSFPCGYQRDIRLHGTLYVCTSHLLFRPTLFFTSGTPTIIPVHSVTRVEPTSDHRLFLKHGVKVSLTREDHVFNNMTQSQKDLARTMIAAVIERATKGEDAGKEVSVNGGEWVGEEEDEEEDAGESGEGQGVRPSFNRAVTHLDFGEARPQRDSGDGLEMREMLSASFPFTSHAFFSLFLSDSAPAPMQMLHDSRGDTDYHISSWKDAVLVTGDEALRGQIMRDLSVVIDPHAPGYTSTRVLKVQKRAKYEPNKVVVETASATPDMTFGSSFHLVDVWTVTDTDDAHCELKVMLGIRFTRMPFALKMLKATVEGRGFADSKSNFELWNKLAQDWVTAHPAEVQAAVANPDAPPRPPALQVGLTHRRASVGSQPARTPHALQASAKHALPVAAAVKADDGAGAAARAKQMERLRQGVPFFTVVAALLLAVVLTFRPHSIPPQLITLGTEAVSCGLLLLVLSRLKQMHDDIRYGNRLTHQLLEAEKKRHAAG